MYNFFACLVGIKRLFNHFQSSIAPFCETSLKREFMMNTQILHLRNTGFYFCNSVIILKLSNTLNKIRCGRAYSCELFAYS